MTVSSNLYANSIFSEHPISLYPLDDDVRYISLITDNERLFDAGGWSSSANNSASVFFDDSPTLPELASPFNSDIYSQVSASVVSNNTTIEIKSPELFAFNELNEDMATFAISCFLYQSSFFVNWYEIGYSYYDALASQNVDVVNRIEAEEGTSWINFDFSFLPTEYDANQLKIILRINVDAGGSAEDYRFIVNGICVGQWSETFSTQSLGVIPSQNALGYLSVPAYEYGIQENSGYYIVEDNKLLAKNDGMPLVYGSTSCTKLYPSAGEDTPSIIFPARGFLNSLGKFSPYTIEFWMNIQPNSDESKKIFGTLDTDDGIYVNNAFISLKIGNDFSSYPISEWYRPMLVHLSTTPSGAILMINGEAIIALVFSGDNVLSSQDWVGFYTYNDMENFSLECISIYPYLVPTQVATRRLVYGQGTDVPEAVAESFDGKSLYINYSNANYNVNKIYPDAANWEGGYSDNLQKIRSSISVPEYSLPEIYIGGRNVESLYADNKIVNELEDDRFFTFRPHVSGGQYVIEGTNWTEPGYIYFNSLGIVDSLSSLYGVFSTEIGDQESTLVLLTRSDTQDQLHIYWEDETIHYSFNNEVLYSEVVDAVDSVYYIVFGLQIKNFINNYGYSLKKFFQSPNNIQAYFGGNGTNTFLGNIYSIGLSNSINLLEISSLFDDEGIAKITEYENFKVHTCTYTLKPFIRFNQYFLDISVSSLWEEYFPLSVFAGYVDNYEGEKYYDIDYLQINLGYPSVYEVIEELRSRFSWNYVELFLDYNFPTQRSYAILDNPVLSGYETYADLRIKNELERFLDTEKSSLRSYITFQSIAEGANEPLSSFPYTRDLVETKYIDADLEDDPQNRLRPYLTKYEFIDNTVVFPPKYFDFEDIAIVFHFVIKHDGILSNPLYVRDFEIISRALDHNTFNAIGSESGQSFYSYIRSGIYYENKTKNPMTIGKKRYPYLYVTENSGIKLLGKQTVSKEYGIAIPINQEKNETYDVNALQLWIKSNVRQFSSIEYPLFEIQALNKTVEFVVKTDVSGQRGMITARDKATRVLESGIVFYQNGIRVKTPLIEYNQWNSLGVSFDTELTFSEYTGYINLFRGASFNNVSHYKTSGLGKTLELVKRAWRRVLTEDDIENVTWASWYVSENAQTGIRTNVATNPSFESNLNFWTANGTGTTIDRISTDYRFGEYCLQCTTGSANNSGVLFANTSGQRMAISPNTEYTVSAYLKIPSGSPSKTLKLRIRQYTQVTGGSALPILDQSPVTFSSSDDWIRIFYTFTSDSSANGLGIEISQDTGNQDGSIFYVDAVLVENSSQLNRYFDGGTAAGGSLFESLAWNGTVNNSTSSGTYYIPNGIFRQWVNIYAITEDVAFALTPEDIYKAFIGTNGFIIDDGTSLAVDADSMNVISDTRWSRFVDTPV